MTTDDRTTPFRWPAWLLLLAAATFPAVLRAQAPVGGTAEVKVVGEREEPLAGISISLERGTTVIRSLLTDRAGRATFGGVAAGSYSLLVEQFGYQPVRYRDLRVEAGAVSRVAARLEKRSGAITSVDEHPANAAIVGGGTTEESLPLWRFQLPSATRDVTEIGAGASEMAYLAGQAGLLGGNGLGASYSQLRIDGLRETLLSHPGVPTAPLRSSIFMKSDLASARVIGRPSDVRFPGAGAGVIDGRTRVATGPLVFQPWLTFSPGLGGRSSDNPADSSALSFQGGVNVGGSIKGDTASWSLGVQAYRLRTATQDPFESATGLSADQLGAELRAAAQARGAADPIAMVVPSVRARSGASGLANVAWNIGSIAAVSVRAGLASWTDKNPLLGLEPSNGTGVELKGSDYSVGVNGVVAYRGVTSTTSLGVRSATRDWTTGNTPFTAVVNQGVAFGTPVAVPGKFSERAVEFNEALSYRYGAHLLNGGVSMQRRNTTSDWIPGRSGEYLFGDLASFQAGRGAYMRATPSAGAQEIKVKDAAAYLQDSWRLTSAFEVTVGIRYDKEELPARLVPIDDGLSNTTGAVNNLMPLNDKSKMAPSASFTWNPGHKGQTVISGSAGIQLLPFDVNALAEVAHTIGGVQITRADGDIGWPATTTGSTRPAFTLYAPFVQRPRNKQGSLGLTTKLGNTASFSLNGGYSHTDYLLRRGDWNRHQLVPSTGSDGRPIYGDLKQYGGLILPATGSNRRFAEYDMISILTGDGNVDHYQVSGELQKSFGSTMNLRVGYTFGKTNDNLLGQLSSTPADQLNPFPDRWEGKDWSDGRSDLDMPHRVVADLRYNGGGPISLTARYHYQSGLPFTPGARRGVDLNGDGSGANDPVALGATIPGLNDLIAKESCLSSSSGSMAGRNSCRDPGYQAVDVGMTWRLSAGPSGLTLTVDALNLIGSANGIRDHAAVLVDPAGTIQYTAGGRVILPLMANEHFGELLSRRGDPRLLRVGFRMGN